jgi:DNA-binding transcriptional LysR family regulator
MMDRLQAMTAFVWGVDTGYFTAAARQLGVGQPAVSKTIVQLEERLQVRLLVRSTHGLAPTDAGLRFYERARDAIREVDEAELEARGAGAGLSGRLRICAATTFARLMIVPRLPEFLAANPSLDVDVILDDRVIDLVSEGIDIALRMGTMTDSTAVARRITTGRRSVVATPGYLARAGTPGVPADLLHHHAVVYSQVSDSWTFRRGSAEESVAVRGRLRVSAAEGIRAAVLADMGVAVASGWMFGPELISGTVQRVLTDWTLPPIDVWAVYPTGRLATSKSRAFAEFVEKILSDPQGAAGLN